jgi:hypothetical protein
VDEPFAGSLVDSEPDRALVEPLPAAVDQLAYGRFGSAERIGGFGVRLVENDTKDECRPF